MIEPRRREGKQVAAALLGLRRSCTAAAHSKDHAGKKKGNQASCAEVVEAATTKAAANVAMTATVTGWRVKINRNDELKEKDRC